MTKRDLIRSALGLLITIGVTILVVSFFVPPSHPGFAASVAAIIPVFVVIEILHVLWARKARDQDKPK